MKAFYIVYNPDKDDDAQVLARLRDYIQEKNCVSARMPKRLPRLLMTSSREKIHLCDLEETS